MELTEDEVRKLSGLAVRSRRMPPHLFMVASAMVGKEEVQQILCDVRDDDGAGWEWRALIHTPTRLIYVADVSPTTLDWTSTFPGSETPPSAGVVSWAHPLSNVRAVVTSVFAHNPWGWTAELTWRVDAAPDTYCTVPLIGGHPSARDENFMAALVEAIGSTR